MIVVIPSNRSINLDFLAPLIDHGARFIIIDDSEGRIKIEHPQFEVYNWSDRDRLLGSNSIAIPRRNGACRSLGFYLAWKTGGENEIVIALDDDCQIERNDFAHQVEKVLSTCNRVVASGSGRHWNIFDIFADVDTTQVFPRGFPYSQRIGYQPWVLDRMEESKSVFNLGLWRGAFDINAIDKFHLSQTVFPDVSLKSDSVLLDNSTLISVCAGSMQFYSSLVPAVYQWPMNIPIMQDWVLDRYGDIWSGFVLKILMDIRGDKMSVGGPLVHHSREAPYLNNVAAEHLGHLVNDEFLDFVQECGSRVKSSNYLDMMKQMHEELHRSSEKTSPVLRSFFSKLLPALGAWLALF